MIRFSVSLDFADKCDVYQIALYLKYRSMHGKKLTGKHRFDRSS